MIDSKQRSRNSRTAISLLDVKHLYRLTQYSV